MRRCSLFTIGLAALLTGLTVPGCGHTNISNGNGNAMLPTNVTNSELPANVTTELPANVTNSDTKSGPSSSMNEANTSTNPSPPAHTDPPPTGPQNDVTVPSADLSNTKLSWWYTPNVTHSTPVIPTNIKGLIEKYHAYYVGNTADNALYLTFDEGYENGYTTTILNTLKQEHVHATFFVTASYVNKNPALVQRMVTEGHLVGNHSATHPSMPDLANRLSAFAEEFTDTETAYLKVTHQTMPKFFRPPSGEYSERTLYLIQARGYKTIFWSFAYRDWDTTNQPSIDQARQAILGGVHNGAIILLHPVSSTNTEILPSVLDTLLKQGYRFETLASLPT